MIRLGVVADTHVPDRAAGLHPDLLEALGRAKVQAILHAGDICIQPVLDELEQVAPVFAVRGNRDVLLKNLPQHLKLTFGRHTVGLLHGHGSLANYIMTKLYYLGEGYRLDRYWPALQKALPESGVVIFGHTHHRENIRHEGRLFFNPGPATRSQTQNVQPSFGILNLDDDGSATCELMELNGYQLAGRQWVRETGKG